MISGESQIEEQLIEKLRGLKYDCREGIHDNDPLKKINPDNNQRAQGRDISGLSEYEQQ